VEKVEAISFDGMNYVFIVVAGTAAATTDTYLWAFVQVTKSTASRKLQGMPWKLVKWLESNPVKVPRRTAPRFKKRLTHWYRLIINVTTMTSRAEKKDVIQWWKVDKNVGSTGSERRWPN